MRSAGAIGAPPVSLPPCKPARRKAVGDPGCMATSLQSLVLSLVFLRTVRRSGTVSNIKPKTVSEQSILELASRSSKSQQQQRSFQPSPHPSRCQGDDRNSSAGPFFPAPARPVGQIRGHFETASSSSPAAVAFRSSSRCSRESSYVAPRPGGKRWLTGSVPGFFANV